MLKEMRRKDRQLSPPEARAVLEKGEYGVLATVGTEYPYAVPVNYAVLDGAIYFHGSCEMGQKAENIAADDRVCFTVVCGSEVLPSEFSEKYESVIVLGRASLADEDEKERALEALIDKYSGAYKEKGLKYLRLEKRKVSVYRIAIEQITGKAHR